QRAADGWDANHAAHNNSNNNKNDSKEEEKDNNNNHVHRFHSDISSIHSSMPPRTCRIKDDADTIQANQSVKLVQSGVKHACKRAAKKLCCVAPVKRRNIAEVIQSLKQKQLPAGAAMEPPAAGINPVAVDGDGIAKVIASLVDNGSRCGPSGATGSHIVELTTDAVHRRHPNLRSNLAIFVSCICNGRFTGDVKHLLLACELAGIPKDSGVDGDVRPIAMGEVLYKTASHYCMHLMKDKMSSLFKTIQYGVGRGGGSQYALHVIRTALTVKPVAGSDAQYNEIMNNRIGMAIDFKNAFNSIHRHKVMERLSNCNATRCLLNFFYWSYAEASPLLVFDYDTNILAALLDSVQGVKQGDPVSAFAFAFTVQQLYKDALAAGDGSVIAAAIQDECTIIRDYRQVFKVFDRLKELSSDYGFELQAHKC
ncbi:MAG: reverse transcriptase domain-containing protein, partial [Aquabacterium sp.]|uniref:reverse transcriptase domain-containing protein n=1 Tax=Aquabacterium sp. TaxID=1872578 RepID=UPI002725EC5B